MKRKIEVVMAVVVMAAAIFAAPKSAQYVMSMKAETMPTVIVIDAGHGGSQLRGIEERQPLSLKNDCPDDER
ncbi:MAG: hypothetical protein LUG54_06225 [Clostridiales bacterium]|nr:hypothetical protein [Clostridiales bacterium]